MQPDTLHSLSPNGTVTVARVARGPSPIARLLAYLLPIRVGASLRWYRRAVGGRWARRWEARMGRWAYVGWRPMPGCVVDTSATVGECSKGQCRCEVYA